MRFSTSFCCYPAIHTVQLSSAVSAAINHIKLDILYNFIKIHHTSLSNIVLPVSQTMNPIEL